MINQMNSMRRMLGIRPKLAKTIGNAIIPLPIQVPAMSKTAPVFICFACIVFPYSGEIKAIGAIIIVVPITKQKLNKLVYGLWPGIGHLFPLAFVFGY